MYKRQFLVSLRRAETMALAMDARGYGSVEQRSSRIVLKTTPRDWVLVVFTIVIAVGIVILP